MPATVWKGYLSFGLVSFPIRLSAAARAETVHFHMLHRKDKSRLREVWYCAEENKRVEREDIVKGFEFSKGRYVVIEDSELKSVAPATASSMEILQFVKADEVDAVYLEKSYYVVPEAAAARPCSLLSKAMTETSFYAIAKMAMHGREHIVIIRPGETGLVLHTMYFENELHSANKGAKAESAKFTPKEMALAKQLIDTLASPFKPGQYKDEYRANVERLIREKRKGHEVTPVEQPKMKPVVDIMDALRQSLKSKGAGKRARKAA
ncbi:MAG: Ku protein [Acidobacteriota bacterium]|nr:Ku protein [Acidobacteriota bacterium]